MRKAGAESESTMVNGGGANYGGNMRAYMLEGGEAKWGEGG